MKNNKRKINRLKFFRDVVMESSMLTQGRCYREPILQPVSNSGVSVKKLGKKNNTSYAKKMERKILYK